jgi:hypothetical protein
MTAFYGEMYKSPLVTKLDFDSLEAKKSKGDRVAFVLGKYAIGDNNPVIGSVWECFGEVYETSGRSCRVNWDNGKNNTYDCADLVLVRMCGIPDKKNPNFLFAQKKSKKKKFSFNPFTR